MRRDALSFGKEDFFQEWVDGGSWPYSKQNRNWLFDPKKKLWSPGKPMMSDQELIDAVVRCHGWRIKD